MVGAKLFLVCCLANNMLPASGINTTKQSLCEPSRDTLQQAEKRRASLTDFPHPSCSQFRINREKTENTSQAHQRSRPFLTFALVLQQRAHWFHIRRSCELQGSGALQFPGGVPTSLRNSGQQWDYPNAWAPLQHMLIEGRNRQTVHQHPGNLKKKKKTFYILFYLYPHLLDM